MNFITEFFFKRVAKGFLDKLPANGKKTILSVAVILLAVAAQSYPPLASTFNEILNLMLSLGAEDWRNAGIVGAIVAALHKVLKAIFPEDQ